jgi:DNA repair REX1-B
VTQATAKFKNLSRLILELASRASSDECRDETLANLIRKVQELEEKKLHLTVDHQLAQQQAQDNPDDELVRP